MHATAERYQERVREDHGLDVEVLELPEGTHSAADAAEAIGCPLGAIVKSVVMAVDGEPVLVLTGGEHRVDEAALAAHCGADAARTATPDEVKAWSGYSIGGVPPVGHGLDRVFLDESLLAYDEVWGGAGTPEAVVAFAPDTIRELTGADPADVFE